MQISEAGIELIKRFEGYSSKAYPDPATGAEPWTIGYGHTRGVQNGDQTDIEQATRWLYDDVRDALEAIQRGVAIPLNQNQIDALASFIYNVGSGNFFRSTLIRKLNEGDFMAAADELLKWDHAGNKVMPGLTRRRKAERELFLS